MLLSVALARIKAPAGFSAVSTGLSAVSTGFSAATRGPKKAEKHAKSLKTSGKAARPVFFPERLHRFHKRSLAQTSAILIPGKTDQKASSTSLRHSGVKCKSLEALT